MLDNIFFTKIFPTVWAPCQHLPLASILKIEISAAFTWLNSAVSSESINSCSVVILKPFHPTRRRSTVKPLIQTDTWRGNPLNRRYPLPVWRSWVRISATLRMFSPVANRGSSLMACRRIWTKTSTNRRAGQLGSNKNGVLSETLTVIYWTTSFILDCNGFQRNGTSLTNISSFFPPK